MEIIKMQAKNRIETPTFGLDKFIGNYYSELVVIRELDDTHVVCECSCGEETIVHIKNLVSNEIRSCGHVQNEPINITGKYYGEWYVDSYVGKRQWNVICSCGVREVKDGGKIRNGYSNSCKRCARLIDLKGKQFGELEVLYYLGERMWMCRCSCGKEYPVIGSQLRGGHTKSCGHNTTGWKDITGQQFGMLTALEYLGNQIWRCICSCENKTIIDVDGRRLRFGNTRSCGCKSREYAKETMLKRYGERCSLKIGNPREEWQLIAIDSKENLNTLLDELGYKPTIFELGHILNMGKSETLKVVHRLGLDDKVIIGTCNSRYETEILELITLKNPNIKVVLKDREILNGKELDIYLPEYNLAIEFNGDYWHSNIYKDKYYHQYKTLECAKSGIRLIHIYEYEWNNENMRKIIIRMILGIINNEDDYTEYSDIEIKVISTEESNAFLNTNSLYKDIRSLINIGAYYKNNLETVICIDKDISNEEYTITQICHSYNIKNRRIITEKIIDRFITEFNPSSIKFNLDISKFVEDDYIKIGFEIVEIMEPEYTWVKSYTGEVINKYTDIRHSKINYVITNDKLMENLGYLKIYDSGRIKLVYNIDSILDF